MGDRRARSRGWARRLTMGLVAVLVTACGEAAVQLSTQPSTMPSSEPVATQQTITPATAPTRPGTVEHVAAWVQAWLDHRFAQSEPPPGVTGAYELRCLDSGTVSVGDVFVCPAVPRTEPGFDLDPVNVVIYVLDESGTAVWEAGTDTPGSTTALLDLYQAAPKGLFCRDLLSPEIAAHPFDGSTRPSGAAYFWSLVYWSLEGNPSRMDADGDGIPCETLFDPDLVSEILVGGPVPLYVRD